MENPAFKSPLNLLIFTQLLGTRGNIAFDILNVISCIENHWH